MYVPITSSLRYAVHGKTENMEKAEMAALGAYDLGVLRADKQLIDAVERALWAAESDLRSRLSKYDRGGVVRVVFARTPGSGVEKRFVDIEMKLPCFVKSGSGYGAPVRVDIPPDLNDNTSAYVERMEHVEECQTRWAKVRSQVDRFLDECKSLNEALKLMPDIRSFIPKEYLDRVDEKVKRAPKEDPAAKTANIDATVLLQSATLARMAGAK